MEGKKGDAKGVCVWGGDMSSSGKLLGWGTGSDGLQAA